MFKDLTIALIGRYQEIDTAILEHYISHGKLAISSWVEDEAIWQKRFSGVPITTSEIPKIKSNVNPLFVEQVELIYTALLNCKTPYFLKVRNDEEIWGIDKIYNKFIQDPEKILCCNVFWRSDDDESIGDHFFMGETKTLLAAFLSMRDDIMDGEIKRIRPEHMFHDYVLKVTESNDVRDSFDLFDVASLDDYKIRYNQQNLTWHKKINAIPYGVMVRNKL